MFSKIKSIFLNFSNIVLNYKSRHATYMVDKDKIEKIEMVSVLIDKSLKTIISYEDFNKMKSLLNELSIVKDDEFEGIIKEFGFQNSDEIFNAIKDYKKQTPVKRIKINEFLGSLSGSTVSTQIQIINDFNKNK